MDGSQEYQRLYKETHCGDSNARKKFFRHAQRRQDPHGCSTAVRTATPASRKGTELVVFYVRINGQVKYYYQNPNFR